MFKKSARRFNLRASPLKNIIYLPAFFLLFSLTLESKEIDSKTDPFRPYFINENMELEVKHNAIIAFGVGGHSIRAGEAMGVYMSGIAPISNTNFNIYGRGELIRDKYKTGHFWSWNMAIGVGYHLNDHFTPFVSFGKCFSNYSTCYFNLRHPTANDDDIDAIYYGAGSYITEPLFNNSFEVAFDWSPYNNYGGKSIYFGYAIKF